MNPFLAGMLAAIAIGLGVGPGLVLYFQASIHRGFLAGLSVLSGLWISDFSILTIGYLGILQLLVSVHHRHIAAIVCAVILMVFGLVQWIKNPAAISKSTDCKPQGKNLKILTGFLSGFLINSTNPVVFVSWMTIIGIAAVNFGSRTHSFYTFFIALLVCSWTFDTTKCLIFSKLSVHFNPTMLKWVNRSVGSVLMLAAIFILCK